MVALIPIVGVWLAPLAGIGVSLLMDWIWDEIKESTLNAKPKTGSGSGFGGGGIGSR